MATPTVRAIPDTPPTPKFAGEASRHYTRRRSRVNTASSSSHIADTPPPETDSTPHAISSNSTTSPSIHSSAIPPHSPPSSAHTSPRKRAPRHRRPTNFQTMDGEPVQGLDGRSSQSKNGIPDVVRETTDVTASHMLPTPVTQPRKKSMSRKEVDSAARVLFPSRNSNVDDAMPHPRRSRKGRKSVGFSLYDQSDDDPDGADVVQIYTDSRDKVPELDPGEDNPFLDHEEHDTPASPSSSGRRTRKRKQHIESNPHIEHAFNRDEGMVYIFRGKKVYRQFPPDSSSEREDSPTAAGQDDNTMGDAAIPNSRPLTRSSIKPRLLFPSRPQQSRQPTSAAKGGDAVTTTERLKSNKSSRGVTPEKAPFRPATPPSTGHAKTRSSMQKTKARGSSPQDHPMQDGQPDPVKGTIKKRSPFDTWARTKAGSGQSKGKKRDAGEMEEATADDSKRAKSGVS